MRAKIEADLKVKGQTLDGIDSAQSWNDLGLGYQNAADGKQDTYKARYCYQQGLNLDADHSWLNYNMGFLTAGGYGGCEKDNRQARIYYKNAIDHGDKECQHWARSRLFAMYIGGRVVIEDCHRRNGNVGDILPHKVLPRTADGWRDLGCKYLSSEYFIGILSIKKLALLCFEHGLKIDPTHADLNYQLATNFELVDQVQSDYLAQAERSYRIKVSEGDELTKRQAKSRLVNIKVFELEKNGFFDHFENSILNASRKKLLAGNYCLSLDFVCRDPELALWCYESAISGLNNLLSGFGTPAVLIKPLHYNINLARCAAAKLYAGGDGCLQDLKKAAEYYELASGNGSDAAMVALAHLKLHQNPEDIQAHMDIADFCRMGKGCEKDERKAREHYNEAIRLGDDQARLKLVLMNLPEDMPKPVSANGWVKAGEYFLSSTRASTDSASDAFFCFKKALGLDIYCDQANYHVGLAYFYGKIVAQNDVVARRHFCHTLIASARLKYGVEKRLFVLAKTRIFEIDAPSEVHNFKTAEEWLELGDRFKAREHEDSLYYDHYIHCNKKALDISPRCTLAHFNLAQDLHHRRHYRSALPQALEHYASAAREGNVPAKLALLEFELDKCTTSDRWNELGVYYYCGLHGKNQDFDKAMLCFLQSLKSDPSAVNANINLSHAFRYGQGGEGVDLEKSTKHMDAALNAENWIPFVAPLLHLNHPANDRQQAVYSEVKTMICTYLALEENSSKMLALFEGYLRHPGANNVVPQVLVSIHQHASAEQFAAIFNVIKAPLIRSISDKSCCMTANMYMQSALDLADPAFLTVMLSDLPVNAIDFDHPLVDKAPCHRTALQQAIEQNLDNKLKLELVRRTSDLNYVDAEQGTAAMLACRAGDFETLRALLKYPSVRQELATQVDNTGRSAVDYSAAHSVDMKRCIEEAMAVDRRSLKERLLRLLESYRQKPRAVASVETLIAYDRTVECIANVTAPDVAEFDAPLRELRRTFSGDGRSMMPSTLVDKIKGLGVGLMVGVETSGVKAAATRVWGRLFTRRRVVVPATPAVPAVAPVEPAAIAVTPVAVTAYADDADPAALKSASLEGRGASRTARVSSDVLLDAAAPVQVAVDAAEVGEEDAAALNVSAGMRAAVGVAAQVQPGVPPAKLVDLLMIDKKRLSKQFKDHRYEFNIAKASISMVKGMKGMRFFLQRWSNHLGDVQGKRRITVKVHGDISLEALRQIALTRLQRFESSLQLAEDDLAAATDGAQFERCKSKWSNFLKGASRVCSLYKPSAASDLARSLRQLKPQQAPVSASTANPSAQEVAVQLSADEGVVVGVRIAMPAT